MMGCHFNNIEDNQDLRQLKDIRLSVMDIRILFPPVINIISIGDGMGIQTDGLQ